MLPFVGDLDVEKTHVQAPTNVVFLCGGQFTDLSKTEPASLRDAFLKIHDNKALKDSTLIQAEDVTKLALFASHYSDLLAFETELAQITELILLFCESEGSLAELGAFAMVPEIARRLMVIMRGKFWEADSFVKLGPILYLENHYGKEAVFVLNDKDIGMRGDSPKDVDISALKSLLESSITARLAKTREPTTFDNARAGHLIKLIVGLIQEYGALTVEEILAAFTEFGIKKEVADISGYLLCAKSVGWITEERRGHTNYFFGKGDLPAAATFAVKDSAKEKDRPRRRWAIREHWKTNDPTRYKVITGTDHGDAE